MIKLIAMDMDGTLLVGDHMTIPRRETAKQAAKHIAPANTQAGVEQMVEKYAL